MMLKQTLYTKILVLIIRRGDSSTHIFYPKMFYSLTELIIWLAMLETELYFVPARALWFYVVSYPLRQLIPPPPESLPRMSPVHVQLPPSV